MSSTIEIKRKDFRSSDVKSFFAKLNADYSGKWIAIYQNGELIARDTLTEIYDDARERESKIRVLFRESKKGQLLFK